MKWTEPWIKSIQNQEKYSLISKGLLISCLLWTLFFVFLAAISLLTKDDFIHHVTKIIWIAPVGGFILAWVLYTITWLSPVKIDSGPKGLVRIKADNITLIPWELISSYRFILKGIVFKFTDDSEITFLLPEKMDRNSISKELKAHSIKQDVL
ncbi:hypothetical protein AN391_02937 [Pseudoalteromonas sp. P1-13-1a]|uniref:hypothetical protein n=1 Tax=unclassified Pseudoalteromonas TaxID=194690 RepID=UPI0006D66522|nr:MULTISPECIES: hypothetical protein [unclassified Pseudoalteromonas]KPZ54338.1 hypothetical protein AN391_02937 [Pseudoalteromonas sp. P1-13-1a]KPZ58087.1 hypothetical protein AN389_03096 [Pseudoalteromonas sp. P1-7a]BED90842.1 hypothetical protein PspMM1_33100 [Pseudoalteromonas sp. MM1]